VSDVVALVAAVAAGIGAGAATALAGLDAQARAGPDERGPGVIGVDAAEDAGQRAGQDALEDGATRGPAADGFRVFVEVSVVHARSLLSRIT
jgi:hypothetical protein